MAKNKKKKKSHNRFNIIYIVIAIVIILITGISCFCIINNKKDMELSYNQFVGYMKNNEVKSVKYSQEKEYIVGELSNGKTFKVENPQTDDFKKEMLEYNVDVENITTISAETLVTLFSLTVMLIFFYFVIGRKFIRANGGIDGKGGLNIVTKIPKIKMDDVAGNEEAKENLMDVVDFLKNPIEYQKYGAKIPKGILLDGVPGVGKTLLGKAIAGEAGVNFIAVSGADFAYKWVGEGPDRVRELFKKARASSPCIIFIDEIDAIGKKRGDADSSNQERDNTLNQLLVEMDGFSATDNIVVIGATNRKDILDAAFRSGRFDRQIQVVPPDLDARIAILKVHSKNKPIASDVDYQLLGEMTIGMTGADLENMMNTASINAAKAKRVVGIQMEDIQKAFDTIIVGDERKNKKSISLQERKITAYHEAGHCLVAKLFGRKVSKVTINPTTRGAGGYTYIPPMENNYETKEDILNGLKILLAGRVSEEIIFGKDKITNGASNDLEVMTKHLSQMLKTYGMGETYGLLNANIVSRANKDKELIEEMKQVSNQIYNETKKLIEDNQDKLQELATRLLEKETISEKEIDSIVTINK